MKAILGYSSLVAFRRRHWLRTEGADSGYGFTLPELLVVLGVLALLALLSVPVLANGKSVSQRAVCASNLARVGRALATWGAERGDLYPWQVLASNGGTRNHPSGLNNSVWFQFYWVSNELVTPKILACPSDRLVRVAEDFGLGTNGFLNASYQNRAVSYTPSHPYPERGRLVLSADRNITLGGGLSSTCGYFGYGFTLNYNATSIPRWERFMHVDSGNLLFNDGSVEQTDDEGLARALLRYMPQDDSDRPSLGHFLISRPPGLDSEREN
jgi:prepilin-type N-terminal cleavage/methylation domain-containing protein